MLQPEGQPDRPEIVTYVRLIWRHKWIWLLTTILAVVGTIFIDSHRTKVYQGVTTILFISQTYVGAGEVYPLQTSDVLTDIELVQSSAVYFHVVKMLGRTVPAPTVSEVGSTDTATIVVDSSNARLAADAANAYAKAYVTVSESQYIAAQDAVENQIQTQIDSVDAQITSTQSQLAGATGSTQTNLSTQLGNLEGDLESLRAQDTQIQVEVSQSPSGGRVITEATVEKSPISPKPLEESIIFGLVGLALGIAISLFREVVDDRIRDRESLLTVVGTLPTLGSIPKVSGWRNKQSAYLVTAEEPRSIYAEAYRSLRTSIRFLGLDRPVGTLQITSPVATEGKTTTAANLAVAMAQTGQRVVLVSCDLRRPRLHAFFGIDNEVGFTSILVGTATLEDALVPVPGFRSFHVLPSGPIPPNPSELLGLPRSREIFEQLSELSDIVIIDSAPTMPVTDSAVLAAQVDAVVLVVTENATRRRDVRHSLETLAHVDARVVGVVYNGVSREGSYGYYRYGHKSPSEAQEPHEHDAGPDNDESAHGSERAMSRDGAGLSP